MTKENQRNSYTITIRASVDDVNLNELIEYFKAIGRTAANDKIEKLILMGLLAKAKKHSGKYSPEQIAAFCLESCDNLSNYASFLRCEFGVIDSRLYSNIAGSNFIAPPHSNNPGAVLNGAAHTKVNTVTASPSIPSQAISKPLQPSDEVAELEESELDSEPDFDACFGD